MLMAKFAGLILETVGSYQPIFIAASLAYLLALLAVHLMLPRYEPPSTSTLDQTGRMTRLHPASGQLFPRRAAVRAIARRLYDGGARLPIDQPARPYRPRVVRRRTGRSPIPPALIVARPLSLRMLYSQGVRSRRWASPPRRRPVEEDPRASGAPSRPTTPVPRHALALWLDHAFAEIFGIRSG